MTEELREAGRRIGFAVETFAGERATLAHVRFPAPPRVGRYGVDLDAFEGVALPALEAEGADLILVDELGKMELASAAFRVAVSTALQGKLPIVATVHVARHAFTDALKSDPDIETVRVFPRNRDDLPRQLTERLLGAIRGQTP